MNTERAVSFELEFNQLHSVVDSDALLRALGYFLVWGLDSPNYAHLTVTSDPRDPGGLLAVYRPHPNHSPKFTLGAVWHPEERRYSFHS